jgi:hypothetical protein
MIKKIVTGSDRSMRKNNPRVRIISRNLYFSVKDLDCHYPILVALCGTFADNAFSILFERRSWNS